MDLQIIRPIQIVQFINKGPKKGRCVDCVPSAWIRFNAVKKRFVSKFIPPPYNEKTNTILYKLVECEIDAPDLWQEYTVKLIGDGRKFKNIHFSRVRAYSL